MKILLRTDAGPGRGTGHTMRCLALAQAARDSGDEVSVVSSQSLPALDERIKTEGCAIIRLSAERGTPEDAKETAAIAKDRKADWIVIDGYDFDGAYQRALKDAGHRVLAIDDYGHAKTYAADVVLNQNASAREDWYTDRSPETKLLLGPFYVVLRRDFRQTKEQRHARSGDVHRIMITFGGEDPQNVTEKVLRALDATAFDGEALVLIGAGNAHRKAIEDLSPSLHFTSRILTDARNMPELMATTDMAIAAAGTTCWELLFMGVPFLVGAFTENQVHVAKALDDQSLAPSIGWYPSVTDAQLTQAIDALLQDPKKRAELSLRGMQTVDGKGTDRVLAAMRGDKTITLRDATAEDANLLWEWANDPAARALSFNQDPIPWEDHVLWFEKKLHDGTFFRIACDADNEPIGYFRCESGREGSFVSIAIAPKKRGKGWSTEVVKKGAAAFFQTHEDRKIHAYVKPENEASRRMFLKAGFTEVGEEIIKGHTAVHFILERRGA